MHRLAGHPIPASHLAHRCTGYDLHDGVIALLHDAQLHEHGPATSCRDQRHGGACSGGRRRRPGRAGALRRPACPAQTGRRAADHADRQGLSQPPGRGRARQWRDAASASVDLYRSHPAIDFAGLACNEDHQGGLVHAASLTIIVVAAVELLLATLFMLGVDSTVAGFAGMGLFLAFCGYQLLVAVKTNSVMCSCAGTSRTDPALLPAIAGVTLACLAQAALAGTLAVVDRRPGGNLGPLTVAAWAAPIIVFLAGLMRQSERSDPDERVSISGSGLVDTKFEESLPS